MSTPATPTTRRHTNRTPKGPVQAIAAVLLVLFGFFGAYFGLAALFGPAHANPPGPPAPPPPTVIVNPVAGDPQPPAPAWPEKEIQLERQGFEVTHEDPEIDAFFSAHIDAAPTVTFARDAVLPEGGKGPAMFVDLMSSFSSSGVVQRDPHGLSKVGWLEDLMPLPGYPYQAISGGKVHFDNGTVVEADRHTSYQLMFPIPAGAQHIDKIVLTFDWLDQGRDLTFHMP